MLFRSLFVPCGGFKRLSRRSFNPEKNDAVTLESTAADKEAAAMKYIAVQHDLTAFEPSKKARPPLGRTAAMRLYYTVQMSMAKIITKAAALVGTLPRRTKKNGKPILSRA